ncbi:hypothetical protein ABZS66_48600 [Dactylosporangium sp. NPDC005572]|uniref:hypothetical protein n=1 Tax=Dactylosporangium sp. NPDC005572 TaxID=3156889 RepID=UPI00339F3387
MPTDPLEQLLAAVGADPTHLGPEELADLARRLTLAPPDEFVLAAARAPGLDWPDAQGSNGYLHIHDREWWVDAGRDEHRAHLARLAVAAAIVGALRLDLTLEWAARLLPAMVTVGAVTVDAAGIHLALRRRPEPVVPAGLADEVHPLDFADLAGALAAAPRTVALPAGGTLTFTD